MCENIHLNGYSFEFYFLGFAQIRFVTTPKENSGTWIGCDLRSTDYVLCEQRKAVSKVLRLSCDLLSILRITFFANNS